jgi:hypothetical protein
MEKSWCRKISKLARAYPKTPEKGERVIKANTRFAPTKPFLLKVGVNLGGCLKTLKKD